MSAVKREIVLSLVIDAHGWEDYLNPFAVDSDIGQFYRNNVVVYSTTAVPDLVALMSSQLADNIIKKLIRQFTNVPASETRRIVHTFAEEYRGDYQNIVSHNREEDKTTRIADPSYVTEASNLIAYLSNKEYFFYDKVRGDVIDKMCGITVTDIREKLTHPDGSVSYNIINFPARVGSFNLIHKSGVEEFAELLDNKLGIGRELDLDTIFNTLKFPRRGETLSEISLVELYNFFKLMQIDYVNIFDLSCRSCKTRQLTQEEISNIGNSEYFASRNVKAFGTTKRRKHVNNKYKKSNKKRKRTNKRGKK